MSCERDSATSYQYFVAHPGQISYWSFSHLFLCGTAIKVFMKVFEAKERQGKAIREMYPWLA